MKNKVLIILMTIVLVFPFYIFAESNVVINNLIVEETEGNASDNKSSVDNNQVILNPNLNFEKDSITYKLVIQNPTNEYYTLDNNITTASKYFDYSVSIDGNSKTLKGHEEKNVYIKIDYKNEVPESLFQEGIFNEKEDYAIVLSKQMNPATRNNLLIVLALILGLFIVTYLKFKNKKQINAVLIFGLLIFPNLIHADNSITLNVKLDIEVENIAEFDTGKVVNKKLLNMNHDYSISGFIRNETLPTSIKTLVENQLNSANEVVITDDQVEEELQTILGENWRYIDHIEYNQENEIERICLEDEDCSLKEEFTNWFIDSFVYLIQNNNSMQYLIYDQNTFEIKLIDENSFIKKLKKKLLNDQKEDILKNVLSSERSNHIIYSWYDEDTSTVYYYCDRKNIYFNPDSSYFFSTLTNMNNLSDTGNINTSKVINMKSMFASTGAYTDLHTDISNWDTSKVTDMSAMFYYSGYEASDWFIGDLSNWDVSKVTDMSYMFDTTGVYNDTWFVGDLSNWDTSNVTNMAGMFSGAGEASKTWNIGDISKWNTSNVTDMSEMFAITGTYMKNYTMNLSTWDTSSVTNMYRMFDGIGRYSDTWNLIGIENWDTSNVENMSYMFATACITAELCSLDLSTWDTSSITDLNNIFSEFGRNSNKVELNLQKIIVNDNEILKSLIPPLIETKEIHIDLANMNTTAVTNFDYLFLSLGYRSNKIYIDVSNWDTSNVTSMKYTFAGIGAWNADTVVVTGLETWNTSNVTDMSYMFSDFGKAADNWDIVGFDNWDMSNVTDMNSMFLINSYPYTETSNTIHNLGNIDIYNANTASMFSGRTNVKATINLHEKLTDFNNMFSKVATFDGAEVVVNYANIVDNIDSIIATKNNSNSNVIKGKMLE